MKNPELFHRSVDVLVKAYQNDTLKHGSCTACAVGNLIHSNGHYPGGWSNFFCTDAKIQTGHFGINIEAYEIEILHRLLSTGYSVLELSKIELSFEMCNDRTHSDNSMLNGLMSVVDTLMQIHEATTEEATVAKELFVKV